jgi:hypothetical protein
VKLIQKDAKEHHKNSWRVAPQAHRGGLVHAVGFGSAIVTAGMYGTITMWPEAELRSIAEAAGFVLPQQPQHIVGDASNPRITISEARARQLPN